MDLLELLAWAVVELQAERPRAAEVRRVLELALDAAVKLDLNHQIRTKNLFRLAQITGVDEGGIKWNL